ncbi:MAG: FixH family protein [Gammaproteobacteria bacterium]|nr:FixH family protein [Gammaproteobacteria bacterium]MBU1655654.1 FixH family protein [Gammaproteobacteria bacterium]MBU1960307.1 FixH family protein [Gammaproteobacteria bacterium]
MAHATREDLEPWYRQFWPWFIISIPAATVVAGLVTLKIAATNPDSLVVDNYYKEGLAINKNLSRERLAKTLGLAADLDIDPETRQLKLSLSGKLTDPPRMLELELYHPSAKDQDVRIKLTSLGGLNYVTRLPDLADVVWKLTLTPENREWKMSGRLKLPDNTHARLK